MEENNNIKIKKIILWQGATIILAILLVASILTGGIGYKKTGGNQTTTTSGKVVVTELNDKRCASCDISGVITQLKQIMPGIEVKTIDYSSEEGKKLYKDLELTSLPALLFTDEVKAESGYKNVESYMEQKGDYLSLRIGADYDPESEICDNEEDDNGDGKIDCDDAKCEKSPSCNKVDKPKMTVWIESMCPFGIQAVNGLARVYDLLKNKATLEVRYMVSDNNGVVSAMHGAQELEEDKREICIREEQGYGVYMKYMRCYAETGKGADCDSKTGVDSIKLATCVKDKAVDYLKADAKDWKEIYVPLGGSGSPSFFLNDFKINEYATSENGRSPENLKNIICSNMKTRASECDTKLPEQNPPRGYGVIETQQAATGGATAASCG